MWERTGLVYCLFFDFAASTKLVHILAPSCTHKVLIEKEEDIIQIVNTRSGSGAPFSVSYIFISESSLLWLFEQRRYKHVCASESKDPNNTSKNDQWKSISMEHFSLKRFRHDTMDSDRNIIRHVGIRNNRHIFDNIRKAHWSRSFDVSIMFLL